MRTLSLMFLVACADAGTAETTLAIENAGADSVSVTLVAGDESEVFTDVAAGTSSESRVVDWATLTGVTVTVDAGTAVDGAVDLSGGSDNLVTVGPDAPVATVTASEPAAPAGGW